MDGNDLETVANREDNGADSALAVVSVNFLRQMDHVGFTPNDELHRTKRGQIPAECVPILERLECSAETWLDFVQNFRQRFHNEAGPAHSRQAYRNRTRFGPTSLSAM